MRANHRTTIRQAVFRWRSSVDVSCRLPVGVSLPTTARCPRVGAGPVGGCADGRTTRPCRKNKTTHSNIGGPTCLGRADRVRARSSEMLIRKSRRSGSQGCRGRIPGYYGGSVAWTVRPLQVEIGGALRSPQSTSTPQHNSRESRSTAERVPGTPKLGRGNNLQKHTHGQRRDPARTPSGTPCWYT